VTDAVLVAALIGEEPALAVFAVGLLLDRGDPRSDARLVPALAVILQLHLAESSLGKIKQGAFQPLLDDSLDDENIAVADHFLLDDFGFGFAHHFFDAIDRFAPLHSEGRLDFLLRLRGGQGAKQRGERVEQSAVHGKQIRVRRDAKQAQAFSPSSFS